VLHQKPNPNNEKRADTNLNPPIQPKRHWLFSPLSSLQSLLCFTTFWPGGSAESKSKLEPSTDGLTLKLCAGQARNETVCREVALKATEKSAEPIAGRGDARRPEGEKKT
jgi:hypothetical protein